MNTKTNAPQLAPTHADFRRQEPARPATRGMVQRAAAQLFLLSAPIGVICGSCPPGAAAESSGRPTVIVVVGAEGNEEYGPQFALWAERWTQAAQRGGAQVVGIGRRPAPQSTDRDRLREALQASAAETQAPLWLVLIGHGTYDGRTARFNLAGPDISAAELAEWCQSIERPLAVVNCASSSGPFLAALAGPRRVVITATRSGQEKNFARFGDYLSAAIGDASADLDKDGQTSLLEAYLRASRGVEEFYAANARLATEHALLDDTGDGLGTPAAWFAGIRAVRRPKDGAALDGALAASWHLVSGDQEARLSSADRAARDALEQAIAALRQRKSSLAEEDYYAQLEPLLIDLARLYSAAEVPLAPRDDDPAPAPVP